MFQRTIAICFVLLFCLGNSLHAQDIQTTDWRAERGYLENEFGNDLQSIGDWCRENGIPQQVEQTFKLFQNRDLARQYIFIPDEKPMPAIPAGIHGEWLKKINEAKVKHAERILKLAQRAAKEEFGGVAYQLLHEVLHYNRDHEAVRKMLGHVKTENGWKVSSDRLSVKDRTRDHDVVQWPAKSYIKVYTPHFEIDSNAGEERTKYLAENLERWHLIWRQVFFEYWSKTSAVQRWIEGKGAARMSTKKFRVVFFKDKDEYLRQLTPLVRGIGISDGYYSKDQRVSFFYDGDSEAEATWRHELTHQLFREARGSTTDNLEKRFIWLDEGVATYFESLTEFGNYVTLGGFDSRRVQFARIRAKLEKFHVPLAELSLLGRTGLQQRGDVVRIYSQVAGVTDMLMNAENGAYEKRLIDFLQIMYQGRLRTGAFERIIGKSFGELDEMYNDYLVVNSSMVERYLSQPESRTELSLPGAELNPAAFEAIGRCVNLNWLDLSQNNLTAENMLKLRSCKNLTQFILTECKFDSNALRALELFPKLDEVDLSGSNVSDANLAAFQKLTTLTTLHLTATAVTDQGLANLASVPNLRSLDVSRTRVTNQGIARLKSRLPNLKVTR